MAYTVENNYNVVLSPNFMSARVIWKINLEKNLFKPLVYKCLRIAFFLNKEKLS